MIKCISIPELCRQLCDKMKRALALTLVICIFSFLKADAQVHRNLRTYFATHLNRPKDAVGHPVTSDSLYCIALTVNSINLDSEIKSDRIKYFALTISGRIPNCFLFGEDRILLSLLYAFSAIHLSLPIKVFLL